MVQSLRPGPLSIAFAAVPKNDLCLIAFGDTRISDTILVSSGDRLIPRFRSDNVVQRHRRTGSAFGTLDSVEGTGSGRIL